MKTFPLLRSLLPVVACMALCMVACRKSAPQAEEKPLLLTSIEPLRFFVEQIAGDTYTVKSIVPDGYNPEDYKPTPDQLMELGHCEAFFKIGDLGFETTWLKDAASHYAGLPVVDTSDSLRYRGMKTSLFDPHTWTSPHYMEIICQSICATLCRMDTTHADTYRANLQRCQESISRTDREIRSILEKVPSRSFITVHPSLTYFADTYGLVQYAIEKEGKEPTPADLSHLIRQSRQEGVKVILVQKQFSKVQAQMIARETGACIVTVNPLGADWHREMIGIAKALRDGK